MHPKYWGHILHQSFLKWPRQTGNLIIVPTKSIDVSCVYNCLECQTYQIGGKCHRSNYSSAVLVPAPVIPFSTKGCLHTDAQAKNHIFLTTISFLGVHLTASKTALIKWWIGDQQATRHYLNQWWSSSHTYIYILTHIYVHHSASVSWNNISYQIGTHSCKALPFCNCIARPLTHVLQCLLAGITRVRKQLWVVEEVDTTQSELRWQISPCTLGEAIWCPS